MENSKLRKEKVKKEIASYFSILYRSVVEVLIDRMNLKKLSQKKGILKSEPNSEKIKEKEDLNLFLSKKALNKEKLILNIREKVYFFIRKAKIQLSTVIIAFIYIDFFIKKDLNILSFQTIEK